MIASENEASVGWPGWYSVGTEWVVDQVIEDGWSQEQTYRSNAKWEQAVIADYERPTVTVTTFTVSSSFGTPHQIPHRFGGPR